MNARPRAKCSFALPVHSSESGFIRAVSGFIRHRELCISLPFYEISLSILAAPVNLKTIPAHDLIFF